MLILSVEVLDNTFRMVSLIIYPGFFQEATLSGHTPDRWRSKDSVWSWMQSYPEAAPAKLFQCQALCLTGRSVQRVTQRLGVEICHLNSHLKHVQCDGMLPFHPDVPLTLTARIHVTLCLVQYLSKGQQLLCTTLCTSGEDIVIRGERAWLTDFNVETNLINKLFVFMTE